MMEPDQRPPTEADETGNLKLVLVPRELYYHEIEYVRKLEKAAIATLMFWKGGEWTKENQEVWKALIGTKEVTSKALCDFIRSIEGLEDASEKILGIE